VIPPPTPIAGSGSSTPYSLPLKRRLPLLLFFLFHTVAAQSRIGRLCEKAERGITVSHPASMAFIFRSPCRNDSGSRLIDTPS